MGGYAIESVLKSLICYMEVKNNFKDTKIFKEGLRGADLHSLVKLLEALPDIQRVIQSKETNNPYRQAWNTVSSLWLNDQLRYSDKDGKEKDSQEFIEAVKTLHRFMLNQQGETS
ncbi:MAG: hypothetical protein EBE86_029555 [Hormoscilla sp. GUM202]|nr:hypothetical protein [Hormoscilla sp. GUM202]